MLLDALRGCETVRILHGSEISDAVSTFRRAVAGDHELLLEGADLDHYESAVSVGVADLLHDDLLQV